MARWQLSVLYGKRSNLEGSDNQKLSRGIVKAAAASAYGVMKINGAAISA